MLKSTVKSLVLTTPPPLTEQPASVYLAGLAPGSRSTMRQALDALARLLSDGRADSLTLDWAALRYKHTSAVRAALMEKYAPATVNKMLSALRRVLKEALRLELMDAKDYARAVDISSIKVSRGLRGRALTHREIAALMEVCLNDCTPAGFRDAALIAILRGSGLRRREVVNLDLRDFDPSTGAMQVRGGKGGKDRTVYLPDSAIPPVEDWLNVRGRGAGPLLCHVNKAGRVVLSHVNKAGQVAVRRLTAQSVLFIVHKRTLEAGLEPLSPHDFRRTFVSDLLDANIDISTVQKLAGHSNPAHTSLYDRRHEETKRRAVQALHIPGTSRRK
jgi:site-specific recombinase XerD